MEKRILFPIFFIILVLIVRCKKNTLSSNFNEKIINQKVVFHYSYENYAWGHQYHGWYIDNNGNIWNLKEAIHWNTEIMDIINKNNMIHYYDSDSLDKRYEDCRDTTVTKVDFDSLYQYYQLIAKASKGDYTSPEDGGADLGIEIFGCLYYNEENKKYRRVLLSMSGDWISSNLDTNAIKIYNWLKKFNYINE